MNGLFSKGIRWFLDPLLRTTQGKLQHYTQMPLKVTSISKFPSFCLILCLPHTGDPYILYSNLLACLFGHDIFQLVWYILPLLAQCLLSSPLPSPAHGDVKRQRERQLVTVEEEVLCNLFTRAIKKCLQC